MSCSTIQNQPTLLKVTMGSLPEGFCGTPQELANAIASRLIVQLNQNNGLFVTGSQAPTSNVGPWLKDCEQWFVWDDNLASYRPIPVGFTNQQYFAASGSFTVPNFTYKLKLSCWGGGGGGGTSSGGASGGGGGGGGFCSAILNVTPGTVIPITVGSGGSNGAPGATGGSTTALTLTAIGGTGGQDPSTSQNGGPGGGATGGDFNFHGQGGCRAISNNGAMGGDSPQGGGGGQPDKANNALNYNGQAPGGGGAAGTSDSNPGNGAAGGCLIEW